MSDKTPPTPAAPPVQAPESDAEELPDELRVPLDELDADASYLMGRVAQDPACAEAMAKSVRVKIGRIRAAIFALLGATPAATVANAEALIAACIPGGGLCDPQAVADAIRAYLAAAPASPPPEPAPAAPQGEPIQPNHLPDLRYVRNVLRGAQIPHHQMSAFAAAINGMEYIIKRTEEASAAPPAAIPAVPAAEWLLSDDALEIGRKAIEDELIEWRDNRLSEPMRGNGLCIRESDGTASDVIRLGPEAGLRIGIKAMLAAAPGEEGA